MLYLAPAPSLRYAVARAALGVVLFLPGVVSSACARARFDVAGTDRVDAARKAVDHVVFGGLIGVVALLAFSAASWAFALVGGPLPSIP